MLRNCKIVDVENAFVHQKLQNIVINVENGTIIDIFPSNNAKLMQKYAQNSAQFDIDCKGGFIMPGLCDAHVHCTAFTADFRLLEKSSAFYVGIQSSFILEGMLKRGFTTVRDAGGADWGLAKAVQEKLLSKSPRVLFCGKAISATGGHGDMRLPGESGNLICGCNGLGEVCDGEDAVRTAVRHRIRQGANHIKVMASGGVSSPTDRIDSCQYSEIELKAVCDEAQMANRYVMAHAYTSKAIARAVRAGVRSIEHGNLMDRSTARLMKEFECFYVPTLITYHALASEGMKAGLSAEMHSKIFEVLEAGLNAIKTAYEEGVAMVYGSDLLGSMHRHQSREFELRSNVVPVSEVVKAATCNAAKLFQMEGKIGVVKVGAYADLLLFEANPLEDISMLANAERNIQLLLKEGNVLINQLDTKSKI
jgi:imidazolonepropionase-like amidohydrolase